MPNNSIELHYGTRHSVTASNRSHSCATVSTYKKAIVTVCYRMLVFLYTPKGQWFMHIGDNHCTCNHFSMESTVGCGKNFKPAQLKTLKPFHLLNNLRLWTTQALQFL